MAVAEISAAITAFSTLKDLAIGLVGERDRQKAAAIEVEFTNKLIEAQSHLTQLLGTVIEQQGRISTLEKRLRDIEAAQAEKERYVLAKLGTGREFFAYRLHPGAELKNGVSEVEHFVCQPCLDAGKKVVLDGNGAGYWGCPVCKHGADTGGSSAVMFSGGRRGFDEF